MRDKAIRLAGNKDCALERGLHRPDEADFVRERQGVERLQMRRRDPFGTAVAVVVVVVTELDEQRVVVHLDSSDLAAPFVCCFGFGLAMQKLDFNIVGKFPDWVFPDVFPAIGVDGGPLRDADEGQRTGGDAAETLQQVQVAVGIKKQADERRLVGNAEVLVNMRSPAVVRDKSEAPVAHLRPQQGIIDGLTFDHYPMSSRSCISWIVPWR